MIRTLRGLSVVVLLLFTPLVRADLRVGAAFRVLTPDPLMPISGGVGPSAPVRGKKGDLFARAMVFEESGTRVAIVGLDFLGFPGVLADQARAKIRGVMANNVVIGSTHTHSAPDMYGFPDGKGGYGGDPKYRRRVIALIAEAVDEAVARLQPAALKIAVGEARGKIAYNYYAPQLYDPRCGVIQAVAMRDGKAGKVIATLVNYASHPEVLGPRSGVLSPDFCGPLYDRIKEASGGMALFMNGAQGGMVTADVRGPDGKDVQTWEECIRIGALLADEALRIVRDAPLQSTPRIASRSREIALPLDSPLIRQLLESSPLDYSGVSDGKAVRTRINLLEIGSARLLTIPGEALPNIGYFLKRKMPGEHDFLLGLTNDAFGYILSRVDFDSFKRYKYISRTCLGEMTGEIYMREALNLVEGPNPRK